MNEDFYSLGANIRSAKLNVAVKNTNSVNTTLMAQGLTEEWTEDELNFNNRPTYNASVVDYCLITPSLTYSRKSIDVTGIFARAISGGNGFFGVMLRAMDESTTNGAIIASAEDTTNSPYFEIEYVETYGMRDIYDYHSMSAGRAGTINVNDFTGTSYIERDELGIDGNIMPVHIKRYYYNSFPNSGIGEMRLDSYGLFTEL